MDIQHADVIIIGSGIAGLMVAEFLSMDKNVIILTKSKITNSNSYLAQGGVAAAINKDDHWSNHFIDTLKAGNFHNHNQLTEHLVKQAPFAITKLKQCGIVFDQDKDGNDLLGNEGAHSQPRILHAGGDATGQAIINALKNRVTNNCPVLEDEYVIDLIVENGRCKGAWSLNKNGKVSAFVADHVVLATGGAGGLYSKTSNDPSITGDGYALAYRAGAVLADMEFIQFHPTLLAVTGQSSSLVSEAVRGEGAKLVDENGQHIMKGIHQQEDLAPRDIVSRTIYEKILQGSQIYLNIREITNFKERFPMIAKRCREHGVHLANGLIPVAPGAHFVMGGVLVDQYGKSTIEHLYAVGEVANTGVHGSNRLASNSLLEGVVFAKEVAESILSSPKTLNTPVPNNEWDGIELPQVIPAVTQIQSIMDENVGIVRETDKLMDTVRTLEFFINGQKCKVNEVNHNVLKRFFNLVFLNGYDR